MFVCVCARARVCVHVRHAYVSAFANRIKTIVVISFKIHVFVVFPNISICLWNIEGERDCKISHNAAALVESEKSVNRIGGGEGVMGGGGMKLNDMRRQKLIEQQHTKRERLYHRTKD